jgi:hypothetical protein
VPIAFTGGLRNILRAPELLGAPIGIALALRLRRRSAVLPLSLVVLSAAGFAVLGFAELPLLERYLLLPAALLVVFAVLPFFAWRDLAEPALRRVALGVPVVLVIVAGVVAPSQVRQLRKLDREWAVRTGAQDGLRALGLAERTRLERCGGVSVAWFSFKPLIAYALELPPADVTLLAVPPLRKRAVLVPATAQVAESLQMPGEAVGPTRAYVRQEGLRLAARNQRWELHTRRC